jgi:DNA-binding NtrC family response regulator
VTGARSVVCLGNPPAERPEVARSLEGAGLSVQWAESVSDTALKLDRTNLPVVVDLSRGAAIHHIREIHATRPRVLIFAVVDPPRPDLTIEAVLAGVADVFTKPLEGDRVARAIDREATYAAALDSRRDLDDLPRGDLYSQSPPMRQVLTQVQAAAAAHSGALIRGEYGSGREMIARSLHRMQGRQAFVTLDCAALDADTLERAIFGNRNASTRSHAGHPERVAAGALLHRANGGTLYVHNVVDLPTRVQARLARAMRDQEVQLRDAADPVNLDVRLIVAADAAIEDAVEDGRLREDLYRRLASTIIDVPPLRKRREDIGPLTNFFVRQICARLRVPPKTLSRPALSLIVALPWRRNAVELRSMLDEVVAGIAGGRGIGLDDVLAHVSLGEGAAISPATRTLRDARGQFEREYIATVLARHRGRIADAARTLGVQRTNLYRKIRELKVERTRRR